MPYFGALMVLLSAFSVIWGIAGFAVTKFEPDWKTPLTVKLLAVAIAAWHAVDFILDIISWSTIEPAYFKTLRVFATIAIFTPVCYNIASSLSLDVDINIAVGTTDENNEQMKNRVLVFFAQSLGLMDYLSLNGNMMASEERIQAQQIQTSIYLLQNTVMLVVKILVVLYENRHFTAFS